MAALVSGQLAIAGVNPGLSVGVAFPGNVTSGNVMLVVGAISANFQLDIADSLGTTFTEVMDNFATGFGRIFMWWAAVPSSGANTVTVSHASSTARKGLAIYEISVLDTTAPFDDSSAATGTGTSVDAGSITMTAGGVILSGFRGSTSVTAYDSDYTNTQVDATATLASALRFTSAITDSAVHTIPSTTWNAIIANFKDAAAGGGAIGYWGRSLRYIATKNR